jgi:two-component sensor histidine kinase
MSILQQPKPYMVDTAHQKERLEQFEDFSAPVRALLALDAGRMGSWSLNVVTGEVHGDRLVANLLGYNYDQQPWDIGEFFEAIEIEDRELVQEAVDKALSGESPVYDVEFRAKRKNSTDPVKWLGARGQVTEREENGDPTRMVGVNWDATDQKVSEGKLAMLAAEMDHRVKNAFAVIRALINLGDRTTNDKHEFATMLRAQVEAMATAHSMSAKMARSTADAASFVCVREIINAALSPWLIPNVFTNDRVRIRCDDDIMIHPRKVSPLAMVLYELSSNAIDHGPLSADEGTIEITVARTSTANVTLDWTEASVATIEPTTTKGGFGAVLLENCAMNLGGSVKQDQTPTGLHVSLTMDVSH